jgi:hypothetical protein
MSPPASRPKAPRGQALIDDPNVGMLFISFPISYAAVVRAFNKGMTDSPKPKVMVALGDTWQLAPDIMQAVSESPAVFSRSSDRMCEQFRSTPVRNLLARSHVAGDGAFPGLPKSARHAARVVGQEDLAAAGIRVPEGELATADEAARSPRVGYPVALKAQAATSHKTEAGGVMLNLATRRRCARPGRRCSKTSKARRPA